MRIAVFGLGYVGSVTAACLARNGHDVVGVDPHLGKVDSILRGTSPVREPGLEEVIGEATASGRLFATTDAALAVGRSDMAFICVGTPSKEDGSLDTSHVETVAREIGHALTYRKDKYTVVLRSTVLPGTTRHVLTPALESASGRTTGTDFDVVCHPEFLREGTSLADYLDPPRIVVGTEYGKPNHLLNELYRDFDAPRIETEFEVAELAKYVDNAWHALKVTFANEVGRISTAVGVSPHEVMDLFTVDTKLNISAKYLKPGFAYGGSCLPKDLAALNQRVEQLGLTLPVLDAVPRSNEEQIEAAMRTVRSIGNRKVGMLGFTFKPNTDDLRNSPYVEMARRLVDEGFGVRVFDPNIDMTTLVGANLDYLRETLPDAESIVVSDAQKVLDFAGTLVLTKEEDLLVEAARALKAEQHLLDLVGIGEGPVQGEHVGIGW